MSQPIHASTISNELYQPNVEQTNRKTLSEELITPALDNDNEDEQVENMTQKIKRVRKQVPFWGENPNVLFQQPYMF